MNYLQLCNKVLDESGKEQNPLTLANWSSVEAGRRLYPRVKRLVAEAWKMIQMKRNEWEFNSGEFVTTIFPRFRFSNGSFVGTPPVGSIWKGLKSNVEITVQSIDLVGGDWGDGTAYGQVQFSSDSLNPPVIGELFEEQLGGGTFEYTDPGSYKLLFGPGPVREPRWNTFRAKRPGEMYNNMIFVPWNNFIVDGLTYAHSNTTPYYFSQDYLGDLVFYGQTMQPFQLSFIYDVMPQTLVDPEDIPTGLPAEYHEWIAWQALANLARFDKDPDLFAYANEHVITYRQRAERNLMPIVEWDVSKYNYC